MRNEGRAKGGYYRTPPAVVEAIARYIQPALYGDEYRLFDPCCGKGLALKQLAELLKKEMIARSTNGIVPNMMTYGIEINDARTRKASRNLKHVLKTSFFDAQITNGSMDIVFNNPPYDTNDEIVTPSGSKERFELSFLKKAILKGCMGSHHIIIVPQHVLRVLAPTLASWFDQIQCWRFPDDEWDAREEEDIRKEPQKKHMVSMYEQFHQVVVIAKKRAWQVPASTRVVEGITHWADMGADLRSLPLDKLCATDQVYTPRIQHGQLQHFVSKAFDPDVAAQLVSIHTGSTEAQAGVWSGSLYKKAHWPSKVDQRLSVGHSMAPIKKAHRAILAVAGMVDGATLIGRDGRKLVVKGYSRKTISYKRTEDEEKVRETKTDRYESALFGIDAESGEVFCIDTGAKPTSWPWSFPFERMSTVDFLENFGESLTEEIARTNPSLYVGEFQVPWARAAFAQLVRKPLGRQRDFILSHVNYHMYHKRASGEVAAMATGKTFISFAIAYLADLWVSGLTNKFPKRYIGRKTNKRLVKPPHMFPVLAMVPEIVTYKTAREAEMTIPGVKTVVIQRIDTLEKAYELRRFAPDWKGEKLSAIGCADVVIARIKYELECWEEACREARFSGDPLPKKPAHVVVVNSSTAKLGMEWSPRYDLRVVRGTNAKGTKVVALEDEDGSHVLVPSCPECGCAVRNKKRVDNKVARDKNYKERLDQIDKRREKNKGHVDMFMDEIAESSDMFLTESEIWGSTEHRTKWFCSECGAPLWQYDTMKGQWNASSPLALLQDNHTTNVAPLPMPGRDRPIAIKSTVNRRYPVADYIHKQYKGFFETLIADEIHQGADGTALGLARESLVSACHHVLMLTGTLCNGKASSLHPILRVLNKDVQNQYGYHGTATWVKEFGVVQQSINTYKERNEVNPTTGAITKRSASAGKLTEKEIAGFAPKGLRFVLGVAGFLELADVAPNLPTYKEYIHVVTMSEMLQKAYDTFEGEITAALAAMLVKGDKSGLAAWFQCLLRYPNMPYRSCVCMVKKTKEVLGEAEVLPEQMIFSKERELIDLVTDQRKKGRRVLIYVENTGDDLDIMPRIQKLLVSNVKGSTGSPPRVAILKSTTVKPIDREKWLADQVKIGCDVLVCNPTLVQVGLDLIDFPTIVFYQIPTSTSKLRQASHRAHRPGQKQYCEVHYLTYPTMEMRMVALMAAKTRVSMMVEGQIGQEGLVAFQSDEDDEDSGDSYALTLANQILRAMKDGTDTHADVEQMAAQLQNTFEDIAEVEQEGLNTVTVVEGSLEESSTDKYIEVDAPEPGEAPAEKCLPVVMEPVTRHKVASIEHNPESDMIEDKVEGDVVVIPASRITDAWTLLSMQHQAQKVLKKAKKKKEVKLQGAKALWEENNFVDATTPAPASTKTTTKEVEPLPAVTPATLF